MSNAKYPTAVPGNDVADVYALNATDDVVVNEPDIIADPFTSKVAFGDVVPIPTLPALVPPAIVILVDPDVTKFILP